MPTLSPKPRIPAPRRSKPGKYAYIDTLEVGDTFFLVYPTDDPHEQANFVQNFRGQLWKRRPRKFETRTGGRALTAGGFSDPSGDPNDMGLRVWRAADGQSLRLRKSPFGGVTESPFPA